MTRPPIKLRHLLLVTLVATTFVGDAAAECAASPSAKIASRESQTTAAGRLFDRLRVGLRRGVRAAVTLVHSRREAKVSSFDSTSTLPDAPVVYRLFAPFLLRLPPPVG